MNRFKRIVVIALCFLLTIPAVVAKAADYSVTTNDSLFKIGQLFKVSIDTLKLENYLKADTIYPGQILYAPAHLYTIKSGDTLYLIATRYGIPLASLRKSNNKIDDLIMPGQLLILPGMKPSSSDSVIPYSGSEVDLLARLIEAEAGGESYQAKVACGAVVINRVQSKEWAPTITDVIYQKFGEYYQFTPVKNGMINKPASSLSLQAAWDVLYGRDPSNGAIYYFDDSSTNLWLWSKPQTAHIDSMVFVK